MRDPIIVVGAGLSGLSAALELEAAGEDCLILESNPFVGGKLETSIVDEAYRLDRGFQILLPSYPELQRFENLEAELNFRYFNSGARLETDSGSLVLANPLEHANHILTTALGNYGSTKDKLLVLKLQADVRFSDVDSLLSSASGSTRQFLIDYGFSDEIISKFWMPFLSGIFLEPNLETEAGFFKYLTRMFSTSRVAVPALGIQELPVWMAKRLKKTEIKLSCRVRSSSSTSVELDDGKTIKARAVLTASMPAQSANSSAFGAATSFWFKAPEAPFDGAWLSLNSRSDRTATSLNHLAVLSNVSRDYAVKGDALICANVVGSQQTQLESVKEQAHALYGDTVKTWQLLRVDRIVDAFPLYLGRQDSDTPSQQGALLRGRLAAQKLLESL